MEKGVLIQEQDINKIKIKETTIYYLGGEFCQNLIPSKNIINYFFQKSIKISVFIPLLSESKINEYKKLLYYINKLNKFKNLIEISISDIGMLNFTISNFPRQTINISRPLSLDIVRMNTKSMIEFIKKMNISAIETDNIEFLSKLNKIRCRIHFFKNFKFIGMQRHCIYQKNINKVCNRKCLEKKFQKILTQKSYFFSFTNSFFVKYKINNLICNRVIYYKNE